MGGSSSPPPPPPPDNTPMLKELELMREQIRVQQEQAAEAQKQAIITSENRAAQQSMQEGNARAQEYLGRLNAYQQAKDAMASEAYGRQAAGMGTGVTGSGIDLNATNALQTSNLAAASGYLPKTAANMAGSPVVVQNPAMSGLLPKTTTSNQFAMPNMANITLGGY